MSRSPFPNDSYSWFSLRYTLSNMDQVSNTIEGTAKEIVADVVSSAWRAIMLEETAQGLVKQAISDACAGILAERQKEAESAEGAQVAQGATEEDNEMTADAAATGPKECAVQPTQIKEGHLQTGGDSNPDGDPPVLSEGDQAAQGATEENSETTSDGPAATSPKECAKQPTQVKEDHLQTGGDRNPDGDPPVLSREAANSGGSGNADANDEGSEKVCTLFGEVGAEGGR